PVVEVIDVEVADHSQAVAAHAERVHHRAHAVLADVEGVLAIILLSGIAVGHHHLAYGSSRQDGPIHPLVVVADFVQHHALARRVADAEAPVLPADLPAGHAKARPLLLDDLQRLQALAKLL